MAQQIIGLFDDPRDAMAAARALEDMGVSVDKVSIIASNDAGWYDEEAYGRSRGDSDGDGRNDAGEDAVKGATTGGVLGAGAGLAAGLGLLAIPGLGPVVAAGWLASTAAGLAAGAVAGGAVGGLVGALRGAGVPEDDAEVYAEAVRRGGAVLTVTAENETDVRDVMRRYNAVDTNARREEYRQTGWSGNSERPGAY